MAIVYHQLAPTQKVVSRVAARVREVSAGATGRHRSVDPRRETLAVNRIDIEHCRLHSVREELMPLKITRLIECRMAGEIWLIDHLETLNVVISRQVERDCIRSL